MKMDENFKGSLWEKLGFNDELCKHCGNHLYQGTCLNGCTLSPWAREQLRIVAEKVKKIKP